MSMIEQQSIEQQSPVSVSRRGFLTRFGTTGLGAALALSATSSLLAMRPAQADSATDARIISAAATAEALATTMYYHIIKSSLYQDGLAGNANDQAYLVAGYEEELDHYNLLVSAGGAPLATLFYFPTGMFGGPETYATTINTLITLEDAFIAAYLIGIRDLSSNGLKVLAGQIMGVECEHRVLGRVVAADLNLHSTTGLSGQPEGVDAPNATSNNLAYERTFSNVLHTIDDVVAALTPFVQQGSPGFSKRAYPFAPNLPMNVPRVTLANNAP